MQEFMELLTRVYRLYPLAAKITIAFSVLFVLCLAVVFVLFFPFLLEHNTLPVLGLVAFVPFILFVTASKALVPATDTELAPIRKEREEIRDRIKEKEPDIFDTIQLNLNQLSEYYTINKSQARNSFRASMSAIVIGFLTIILGSWFFYLSTDHRNDNLAYLSALSGVLLQFIGGAYFYLYNKSLAQLNFFFARLTTMQDTMLAIKLSDQILEPSAKMKVLQQLIFEIITRDAPTRKYLAEGTLSPQPSVSSQKKISKAKGNDAKNSIATFTSTRLKPPAGSP